MVRLETLVALEGTPARIARDVEHWFRLCPLTYAPSKREWVPNLTRGSRSVAVSVTHFRCDARSG